MLKEKSILQVYQDYQLKNNDGDFLQRLEKYEQNRKLKMAELHKEEFIRLQKETEKIRAEITRLEAMHRGAENPRIENGVGESNPDESPIK